MAESRDIHPLGTVYPVVPIHKDTDRSRGVPEEGRRRRHRRPPAHRQAPPPPDDGHDDDGDKGGHVDEYA
ncbi:MAG: hypothetical protein U5S82_21545 [Gammaproteobacteria bacterium]|nr:hypothetical protein [Gammaproteobacteria bacterium]